MRLLLENVSFCLNKNLESCDIFNMENQKIGNCFYLNFDKNKNISLDNKVELINKFLENQIKALISYCLFIEKLQQNIKSSKIINSECYLIEENLMKNNMSIQ